MKNNIERLFNYEMKEYQIRRELEFLINNYEKKFQHSIKVNDINLRTDLLVFIQELKHLLNILNK